MASEQSIQWQALWARYFKPIDAAEVADWEYELMRIPEVDQASIRKAIRAMADSEKTPAWPKLSDLMRAVRAAVAAHRAESRPPDEECAVCGGTRMAYAWADPQDPRKGYRCVPCACSPGVRIAWTEARSRSPSEPRAAFERIRAATAEAVRQFRAGVQPFGAAEGALRLTAEYHGAAPAARGAPCEWE